MGGKNVVVIPNGMMILHNFDAFVKTTDRITTWISANRLLSHGRSNVHGYISIDSSKKTFLLANHLSSDDHTNICGFGQDVPMATYLPPITRQYALWFDKLCIELVIF